MQTDRIAALLEPFLASANGRARTPGLTQDDLLRISMYIDILLRWNARINLTAIRDPEQIVTRHFGESFFAARHLFPERQSAIASALPISATCRDQQAGGVVLGSVGKIAGSSATTVSVADLGSGAGFPGLPIKLWAPFISLTLVESNQKKVAFLREVTRALALTDVKTENARAEGLPAGAFDVVTMRAVEKFEGASRTAGRLVAPRGRVAFLLGTSQLVQVRSVLTEFDWAEPIAIPVSVSRILAMAYRGDRR